MSFPLRFRTIWVVGVILAVVTLGCVDPSASSDAARSDPDRLIVGPGPDAVDAELHADLVDLRDGFDAFDPTDVSDATEARDTLDASALDDATDLSPDAPDGSGQVRDEGVVFSPASLSCHTASTVRTVATFDLPLRLAVVTVPSCGALGPARAVFVRAVVGPASRLSAYVASPDVSLSLHSDCDTLACVPDTVFLEGTRTLTWTNPGDQPVDVILSVASRGAPVPELVSVSVGVAPALAEDRCAEAPVVPIGESELVVSTPSTPVTSLFCEGGASRDSYRAVDVPAGHTLRAESAEALSRVFLRLGSSCRDGACLGFRESLSEPTGGRSRVVWRNVSPRTERVILAISSADRSPAGPARVRVRVMPTPRDAECALSPSFVGTASGVDLDDAVEARGYCGTSSSTRLALTWPVTVPAGHRVVATARGSDLRGLGLAVRESCEGVTCLVEAASGSFESPSMPPTQRELHWLNLGPTSRVVIVEASRRERIPVSRFDLATRVEPSPPEADCARAHPLEVGAPAQTFPFADAGGYVTSFCGAPPDQRFASYHRVSVPPGRILELTSSASLSVMGACDAACLPTQSLGASVLTWGNTERTPREVFVAARGPLFNTRSSGSYTLRAQLLDAAPESRCATAPLLDGPTTLVLRPERAMEPSPPCIGRQSVPAVFFRVRVPARHSLRVVPVVSGWSGPVLAQGCGPNACFLSESRRWTNVEQSDAELTLIGIVSGVSQSMSAEIHVDPIPTNTSCELAQRVNLGERVTVDHLFAQVRPNCWVPDGGPALFYRVSLPPRSALTASTAVGFAGWVAGFNDCATPVCRYSQRDSFGTRWIGVNEGDQSRDSLVAVGGPRDASPTEVTLRATTIPAEARCASAPLISGGQSVTSEVLPIAAASPPCAPLIGGRMANYYSIEVPAGQRLSVQVRCGEGCHSNPVLSVVSGCDATHCLPTTPLPGGGRAWTNPDSAPRRVVVVVESPHATTTPVTFTLWTSFTP